MCVTRCYGSPISIHRQEQFSSSSVHVYTLLTLPTTTRSTTTKSRRVLVRSTRRLQQNDDDTPLHVHVHLEYFLIRGWEEPTCYERALWILDKVLHFNVAVANVCPETFRVLQWQEVGVAHALASTENPILPSNMDPMNHWEALLQVLHAMETMQEGQHLLCLESRSISVHMASDKTATIDLNSEFEKADSVYTGPAALRQCARVWRWKEERVPYTFPIQQSEAAGGRNR